MSIKLQEIKAARQQIGEAWSQLEQARQTLERLGVRTGIKDHQGALYTLAMRLEEDDSIDEGGDVSAAGQPRKAEAA